MVVAKPNDINDFTIWGDLTESVLINYELDVYDKGEDEYYIEIEHRPTSLMTWLHQIERKPEAGYDRITDTYKIRFPMKMVLYSKARTEGSFILMGCDYKGTPTKLLDRINKRIWDENEKLRTELKAKNSMIIRTQSLMIMMVKHPKQFEKEIIKRLMQLRKGTAPAYFEKEGDAHNLEEES